MNIDRGEMRNLAVESKFDDILDKHRDILYKWMIEHNVTGVRPTPPAQSVVPGKK